MRLHQILPPIATSLALLLAAALGLSLATGLDNAYLGWGFLRTPVYVAAGWILRLAWPTAVVAVGAALLARLPGRWARWLTAVAAGAAYFAIRGLALNRFELAHSWFDRREIAGLPLPEPLFHWETWQANLVAGLGALLVGLAAAAAMRLLQGRDGTRGGRLWKRLGAPGVAAGLALLVAVPPLAARLLREGGGERPSFILVSLDTLRADHLGAYGYHRDTSPELDRLAGEGILFELAVSPAPNTGPAHMSLFTSLYPGVHGFTGDGDRLAGWQLTLAEYFREAGYRTAAITDGGFLRRVYGFDQGFEQYHDYRKGIAEAVPLALRWLDEGLAETPFFLFLHVYDVHSPYVSPEPWNSLFTDPDYEGELYPGTEELEEVRARSQPDVGGSHGLSNADVGFLVDRYDGGIRYVDHWMGEFARALRERIRGPTWLVITSDHGEEFTEHGSVLHEKLYHTVTRVPLIAARIDPESGLRPRRVPEVVELTDLMPTFLELAGIEPVEPLRAQSLAAFLRDEPVPGWKNVAFSEHPWHGRRRAITRPGLHVLTGLDRPSPEPYDTERDPLERSPLTAPARADEIGAAFDALLSWTREQEDLASQRGAATRAFEMDAQTEEELKSLGYLQ